MTGLRLGVATALVAGLVAGAVIAVAVRGAPALMTTSPPPVTTATVVRTDLATTVLTGGTLGYAPTNPVVNRLAGTYTQLPAVGTTVVAGQSLYRVDDIPVVLMTGTTPAWRAFAPGMSDGPDVAELQQNLIALGDAHGLLSAPTSRFDAASLEAVKRWQAAEGYPPTGAIAFGDIAFLPAEVRVGAEDVVPGQVASAGDIPYQVTSSARTVIVPINPDLPSISVGETVTIVLPSNVTTPGRVEAIGPAAPAAASGSSNSGGTSQSQPATELIVTPEHPSVTGTGSGITVEVSLASQSVTGVLAVPISALLALAGGGYGVEVVMPSGSHRLLGVTTGVFANTRVEVRGPGIEPGTKVVVAQ